MRQSNYRQYQASGRNTSNSGAVSREVVKGFGEGSKSPEVFWTIQVLGKLRRVNEDTSVRLVSTRDTSKVNNR